MSHEEYAVLVEVLRRAPVTLAEQLVIGTLLEKLAPKTEPVTSDAPACSAQSQTG